MLDYVDPATRYCTDGRFAYVDIIYPGQYVKNTRDKSDAFTVEGVNFGLRHCTPPLARCSRCFAPTLETLKAVIKVFVSTYNRFGQAKYRYRLHRSKGDLPFTLSIFFKRAVGRSQFLP